MFGKRRGEEMRDVVVVKEKKPTFLTPNVLIASCFLLYTSMMAAKGVFLAEIAYLMEIFSVDKATASLANTYYFVSYAGVQVLLFFIVKRLNVRKLLTYTVPFAAVATAAMGLSRGIGDMYVLFAVCGLFQAGVYCGCNATLTAYLPARYLSRANSVMNLGYASGTVIAFVFSAMCVRFDLWRVPFFVMGAFLFFATCFYTVCAKYAYVLKRDEAVPSGASSSSDVASETPFLNVNTPKKRALFYSTDLILVFLITCLYYAINNWISTWLVDVYSMSQDISIYITILAPTLIALGPMMTIRYCDKHRDFIRGGVVFTIFALPIPFVLAFFYSKSLILAFVLSVVYIILINGVKSIGLSVMAFKLRGVVNTAEYTAIANAVASLAGGVAPTVVGKIIDGYGWNVSYFAVFAVTALVLVAMVVIDIMVRKAQR